VRIAAGGLGILESGGVVVDGVSGGGTSGIEVKSGGTFEFIGVFVGSDGAVGVSTGHVDFRSGSVREVGAGAVMSGQTLGAGGLPNPRYWVHWFRTVVLFAVPLPKKYPTV
jgi:hypothetical protein